MKAPEPGEILGSYRVVQLVGRGGMGSVYEAEHVETGERRALKIMHEEAAQKASFRQRFLREARAAMAVSHPNIVRFFEIYEHEATPIIAMELLAGRSLEHDLLTHGKMTVQELSRVLLPIVSAVGHAHALGIVHRDLKPENIFIQDDGNSKLLDFGIVKLTHTDGAAAITQALTQTGFVLGTPFYMSPEQASGEKKIDQRSDIWSMGIIFYRCLSGILPTESSSFPGVFKKIVVDPIPPLDAAALALPKEMVTLIERMLAKRPDDRPWDLREVFSELSPHATVSVPVFSKASDDAVFDTSPSSEQKVSDGSGPVSSGGTLVIAPESSGRGLAPLPLSNGSGVDGGMTTALPRQTALLESSESPWKGGSQTSPVYIPKNSRLWIVVVVLAALAVAVLVAAWMHR